MAGGRGRDRWLVGRGGLRHTQPERGALGGRGVERPLLRAYRLALLDDGACVLQVGLRRAQLAHAGVAFEHRRLLRRLRPMKEGRERRPLALQRRQLRAGVGCQIGQRSVELGGRCVSGERLRRWLVARDVVVRLG